MHSAKHHLGGRLTAPQPANLHATNKVKVDRALRSLLLAHRARRTLCGSVLRNYPTTLALALPTFAAPSACASSRNSTRTLGEPPRFAISAASTECTMRDSIPKAFAIKETSSGCPHPTVFWQESCARWQQGYSTTQHIPKDPTSPQSHPRASWTDSTPRRLAARSGSPPSRVIGGIHLPVTREGVIPLAPQPGPGVGAQILGFPGPEPTFLGRDESGCEGTPPIDGR